MIIKKIDQNHWEIKTKLTKITLNDGAIVGDFKIPGTGEYDVADVAVEVIDGIISFFTEDIETVFIRQDKKNFSDEEIKKLSKCNILFLPVAGAKTMDVKTALNLVSEIDPEIVIPVYYEDLSKFSKSEGSTLKEIEELKITKNDLTGEERQIIILQ
jgi:hypothetical protein